MQSESSLNVRRWMLDAYSPPPVGSTSILILFRPAYPFDWDPRTLNPET